jgi:hypothetical protein
MWTDWLIQMSANLAGTLVSAAVIYLVGIVAGVITVNIAIVAITGLTVLGGGVAYTVLAIKLYRSYEANQRLGEETDRAYDEFRRWFREYSERSLKRAAAGESNTEEARLDEEELRRRTDDLSRMYEEHRRLRER